jgi:predicted deacetylase
LLERVYGRLWAHGIPVCLAVIPAQRSDTVVEYRPGKPYDPSIPPDYRGLEQEHPITHNPALCDFLNEKAKTGLVEICLHGYDHGYLEFTSEDRALLEQKLASGHAILHHALPDASIRTFIAPYDRLSDTAIETVIAHGYTLCSDSANFASIPTYSHIGAYQVHPLQNGRRIVTCDEYLFTHRRKPGESISDARHRMRTGTLLVLANHYWTFFYDWNGPNTQLLAEWDLFVDDLLTANGDHQVTTFWS